MASEVPLMYGMVMLLCYLRALIKVLLLLCSMYPTAVAPSCTSSGHRSLLVGLNWVYPRRSSSPCTSACVPMWLALTLSSRYYQQ